jgi:hypothetical protein
MSLKRLRLRLKLRFLPKSRPWMELKVPLGRLRLRFLLQSRPWILENTEALITDKNAISMISPVSKRLCMEIYYNNRILVAETC